MKKLNESDQNVFSTEIVTIVNELLSQTQDNDEDYNNMFNTKLKLTNKITQY